MNNHVGLIKNILHASACQLFNIGFQLIIKYKQELVQDHTSMRVIYSISMTLLDEIHLGYLNGDRKRCSAAKIPVPF